MATDLFRKIMCPSIFHPVPNEAFRVALQMAKAVQSELILLHVIDTSAVAAGCRM